MRVLKKKYWPHIVTAPWNDTIKVWLEDNMGKKGGRWYNIQLDFYFRTESDAVFFALKWT